MAARERRSATPDIDLLIDRHREIPSDEASDAYDSVTSEESSENENDDFLSENESDVGPESADEPNEEVFTGKMVLNGKGIHQIWEVAKVVTMSSDKQLVLHQETSGLRAIPDERTDITRNSKS